MSAVGSGAAKPHRRPTRNIVRKTDRRFNAVGSIRSRVCEQGTTWTQPLTSVDRSSSMPATAANPGAGEAEVRVAVPGEVDRHAG